MVVSEPWPVAFTSLRLGLETMPATTSSFAPLFGAIPGGPEMLIVLFIFVIPVGLALWVGTDARDHSDHPLAWGLTVFVAGFSPFFIGSVAVAFLYFISRDELGSYAPPTFHEDDMDDDTMVLGQRLGDQRRERAERETAENDGGSESN
jgi:RsiW-degrading membrane proteinase PrsW (M82 family)